MGNSNTKEAARPGDAGPRRSGRPSLAPALDAPTLSPSQPNDRPSSRRNRASRADLGGLLGLGAGGPSGSTLSHERRETKQEREAKRLEKERIARLKERERSMKEEHVDGGYLVTLGTYIGPEDFSKPAVRQLQLERKLAPFWRGLNDFNEQWAEHQIIAAVRGLPIPAADQTPPEELLPRRAAPQPVDSPTGSIGHLNLTVPIDGRSSSVQSDHGAGGSANNSTLPSPVSAMPVPGRTNSPFKARPKALAAALSIGSRNNSSTDIAPREISLPTDPFVNGQPLELFLYKDASECPICFLYYPPYLNHTRCCDQPICSECFVQIKRPDPHYPEGHGENDPNHNPEESAGMLISEPACCPYCQQPDFGVTYDPPPFRRGLAYLFSPATAMSSSTSLNSTLSPTIGSPTSGGMLTGRRRTESLSANAPNVILTDKVRPDWSTKLNAARAHLARRAAAATALHTAAFLMGGAQDARPFRVGRFSRRNTGTGMGGDNASAGDGDNAGNDSGTVTPSQAVGIEGPRTSSARAGGLILAIGDNASTAGNGRSRMDDLEDMMLMEAIRLSLAAEEERKRKAEKEERKEAKKREKEERKAARAAQKSGGSSAGPYDAATGQSSATGSTLSLPGLGGIGRRRGNSGASNLRVEASLANAMASSGGSLSMPAAGGSNVDAKDKGKGVDRGPDTDNNQSGSEQPNPPASSGAPTLPPISTAITAPRPIPSPHHPAGPSHLRQMSSASSVSSSLGPDSVAGSYTGPSHLPASYLQGDPRASALSLGGRSAISEDAGDHDRDPDPSASTEPMFNFRSLAEMVGVEIDGQHAGRRLSTIEAEREAMKKADGSKDEADEDDSGVPSPQRQESSGSTAHSATTASALPPKNESEEGIFDQHIEDISQSTLGDVEESVATLTPDQAQVHTQVERLYGKPGPDLHISGGAFDKTLPAQNGESLAPKGAQVGGGAPAPPTLMITPETPAPVDHAGEESKQLGFNGGAVQCSEEVTQ